MHMKLQLVGSRHFSNMDKIRLNIRKYIENIEKIGVLSSPKFSFDRKIQDYIAKLRENFVEIGRLAAENREILDHYLFPVLQKEKLSDTDRILLKEAFDALINGYTMENVDIPIATMIADKLLDDALERILALTDEAFENDDTQKAAQVEPLEEIIDVMVERLRDQHIRRLKDGICSIDTGVVFLDVLNNAERISDHCSNIAVRMVGMEAGEDYDSHTLKNIMHHSPSKDYMLEYEQCRKEYLVPLEEMEA